jgi:excinuclease UvrABC nuclease subunit
VTIPEPIELQTGAPSLRAEIDVLPPSSGIYALRTRDKVAHLSWSSHLPRRLRRLISAGASSEHRPSRLPEAIEAIHCWPTGSRLETSIYLYFLTKTYFANEYAERLRLRMPWMLAITGRDPFPRFTILNRVSRSAKVLIGPFQNRDSAQRYEQELLGLFQVRRCTETLAPSADHPGCMYGEMNQCLRPCQLSVSANEYASEVKRALEFLSTNGKQSMAALSTARDRAAENTDFEQAAELHNRLERVKRVAATRDPVIREMDDFSGVALTRAAQARQLLLWPLLQGHWQAPVRLDFRPGNAAGKSIDHDVREKLKDALARPCTEGPRLEELAIFSRWYYSSWRDGEWFPFHDVGDLSYRSLVRKVSSWANADQQTIHSAAC